MSEHIHEYNAMRAQRAREYFIEASRPLYQEMAKIQGMFAGHRMIVDKDGQVISHETTLPDFAQAWIKELQAHVEMCRRLAENDARGYWP
jgi:hypothetical protein